MCDVTFVGRASDGLLLAETWTPSTPPVAAAGGRIGGGSGGSSSSMSTSGLLRQQQQQQQQHALKQQAKQLLKRVGASGCDRCSIDAGPYKFHYLIEDGVIYMVACDASYPKKLAFSFLEEIQRSFVQELQFTYGTHSSDYRSFIDSIERPYHFIRFDRVIQKKRLEYRDPSSGKALEKLNHSLAEVTHIMRKNIDEILQRGENIEDVGRKASDLKDASEKFSKLAKILSFRAMMQQYAPFLVVVAFFLILIFWKFFL